MISQHHLTQLAPRALPVYLEAFEFASVILPRWEINTPLRAAHALAQWLHETGGLTVLSENLNYTSAERLVAVWPSRFKGNPKLAAECVRNPEKLANTVYAGRMGNTQPGDGWRFRGRGLVQLTGRSNYARFGPLVGTDLCENPDRATDPLFLLPIAAAFWISRECNTAADRDDIVTVTRLINGGTNGLADRTHQLQKVKAVMGLA